MSRETDAVPRGDRMTPAFFEDVLAEYLDADRIEEAVVRLELDDGTTRRVVVAEDTESLGPDEYAARELAEARRLIEGHADRFEAPAELTVPVRDADRVREEIASDDAVTTWVKPEGVAQLLGHFEALTRAGETADPGASVGRSEASDDR
ncbi:hypothetical protein [Halorubrum sp. LN27]|uniref:hypothetical protein n=1 Tax=Halorubrum sp. LN27 TaxID=2801032 RepID=UPI00190B3FCB|nr:hypothetical protein [Halorubrum sp. LN27]